MYQIGDLVIYGDSGACRVEAIGKLDVSYIDRSKLYYTLRPIYRDGKIYAPTETKVFMRPVLTFPEAQRIIGLIPSIKEIDCLGDNHRILKEHYSQLLLAQGIGKTASVVKDCVTAWLMDDALVFTNFKTKVPGTDKPFSYVMNFHDIVETLNEYQDQILEANKAVMIGLMEARKIAKYYDTKKIDFFSDLTSQLRKFNADASVDSQRNLDLPPALRDNVGATLLPCKVHDDGEICREPKCKLHHTIEVREVHMRERGAPDFVLVDRFDAAIYGQFYNSFRNEIVEEPGQDETDIEEDDE
jgi:CarD family transcriptional regulator